MARLPRITVRGIAHPVMQRGNGRQQIFIEEDDYGLYRDLLPQHRVANGVEVGQRVQARLDMWVSVMSAPFRLDQASSRSVLVKSFPIQSRD